MQILQLCRFKKITNFTKRRVLLVRNLQFQLINTRTSTLWNRLLLLPSNILYDWLFDFNSGLTKSTMFVWRQNNYNPSSLDLKIFLDLSRFTKENYYVIKTNLLSWYNKRFMTIQRGFSSQRIRTNALSNNHVP